MNRISGKVDVFDPLHDQKFTEDSIAAVKSAVQLFAPLRPNVEHSFRSATHALQQSDHFNCGVFIVVVGLYWMHDLDVPDEIDISLWRRAFGAMLMKRFDVSSVRLYTRTPIPEASDRDAVDAPSTSISTEARSGDEFKRYLANTTTSLQQYNDRAKQSTSMASKGTAISEVLTRSRSRLAEYLTDLEGWHADLSGINIQLSLIHI